MKIQIDDIAIRKDGSEIIISKGNAAIRIAFREVRDIRDALTLVAHHGAFNAP